MKYKKITLDGCNYYPPGFGSGSYGLADIDTGSGWGFAAESYVYGPEGEGRSDKYYMIRSVGDLILGFELELEQ